MKGRRRWVPTTSPLSLGRDGARVVSQQSPILRHHFARHLDWHNDPTHLDLARLVRQTGTAKHFVAASSSIAKWVAGSKNKAGRPPEKFEYRNPKSETNSKHKAQITETLPHAGESVWIIEASGHSCLFRISSFVLRVCPPVVPGTSGEPACHAPSGVMSSKQAGARSLRIASILVQALRISHWALADRRSLKM